VAGVFFIIIIAHLVALFRGALKKQAALMEQKHGTIYIESFR